MGIYGYDVSKTEWPKLVVTMNKSYLKMIYTDMKCDIIR